MKLMICLSLAVFHLYLPVIAQPIEKIAPEIQTLIEKIQSGNPSLKKIMEVPGDGKVFPYRYFLSGIPRELKGKGIEDAFKWDASRKVNKELSGEGYRLFEDGTICLPVTFGVTRKFTDTLSQEVNPKIQENRILEREAFIKKYEVSWVSDQSTSIVIILPVKNLSQALNDSLIKKAGDHFGFFIPGEKIGERDIAVGFYDNYVIRKRQLTRTDIENAFISDLKHSKTKSRENRIGKDVKYLNQISLRLKDNVTEYELKQILKKEVKYGYEIYKINALNIIRFSEEEDIFILMGKLKKYKGMILITVGINFLGTGDALIPNVQK